MKALIPDDLPEEIKDTYVTPTLNNAVRCSRDLALWRRRNNIGRYSTVSKRKLRSQFPLFP